MKHSEKGMIDSMLMAVFILVLLVGGFALFTLTKDDSPSSEETATSASDKERSAISYEIDLPKDYEATSSSNPRYYFNKTLGRLENPYSFAITEIDDESVYFFSKSSVAAGVTTTYKQDRILFIEEVYNEIIPGLIQNRNLTDVTHEIVERDIEGTTIDHVLFIDAKWVNNIGEEDIITHQIMFDDNLNMLLVEVLMGPAITNDLSTEIEAMLKSVKFTN